ncbi:hypothetical protein BZG36_02017 [Bifiguratus adelaidae]|uniref:Zn(2)-C6 fungal-type domain-containing protein n=1 Tax=Bifiguratus adelaidae TaxID=1938954 RepID=A0A261Y453_9FUNG|nr:hypothetical protein BZG36_02017 [Bifiguratus adelaidae]
MTNQPPGKRKKVSQACERCRRLKRKCDGSWPVCRRCRYGGEACRYEKKTDTPLDKSMQHKLDALENTVQVLASQLSKLQNENVGLFDGSLPSAGQSADALHDFMNMEEKNAAYMQETPLLSRSVNLWSSGNSDKSSDGGEQTSGYSGQVLDGQSEVKSSSGKRSEERRQSTTSMADESVLDFEETIHNDVFAEEPYYSITAKDRKLSIHTNIVGLKLLTELFISVNPQVFEKETPGASTELVPTNRGFITQAIHKFHGSHVGDQSGRVHLSTHLTLSHNSMIDLQHALINAYRVCIPSRVPLWHDKFFYSMFWNNNEGGRPHPVTASLCAYLLSWNCVHTQHIKLAVQERFDLADAYYRVARDAISECLDDNPTIGSLVTLSLTSMYIYLHSGATTTSVLLSVLFRATDDMLRKEPLCRPPHLLTEQQLYCKELLKRSYHTWVAGEVGFADWFGFSHMDPLIATEDNVFPGGELVCWEGETERAKRIVGFIKAMGSRFTMVTTHLRQLRQREHEQITVTLDAVQDIERRLNAWYFSLPPSYAYVFPGKDFQELPVELFNASDMLTESDWKLTNEELRAISPAGLHPLDAYTVSQLLAYYALALKLHMAFTRKEREGTTLTRSEVICARASMVVTMLMEYVNTLDCCSIDYDICYEAADAHLQNTLMGSNTELMKTSLNYLIRWLRAAKAKQTRYRPPDSPLYQYLYQVEEQLEAAYQAVNQDPASTDFTEVLNYQRQEFEDDTPTPTPIPI